MEEARDGDVKEARMLAAVLFIRAYRAIPAVLH